MSKTVFICSECGYQTSKWLGKCPECNSWNSFIEEIIKKTSDKKHINNSKNERSVISLKEIQFNESDRFYTKIDEFDRVIGGFVKGQTLLLAGAPGVGKSTLILKISMALSNYGKILYINGEESNSQVKSRCKRLAIESDNILLCPETEVNSIIELARSHKPLFIVIDSIQTLYIQELESTRGSIVQVRECVYKLNEFCKENNIVLILIGHINKEGMIAGPKVIEHIVDTIIFFDQDLKGDYRTLKSYKNRFYHINEIGYFTMETKGLEPITDLNKAFIYNHDNSVSGISIYPHIEGNRVFPVEIQALCIESKFNYPKRTSEGFDINRLLLLIAVIEKHLNITLSNQDIYLNITNGLIINDPAIDLAIVYSIFSSMKNIKSDIKTCFFGEVGLTGEIRKTTKMDQRMNSLMKLGYNKIVLPYIENFNYSLYTDVKLMPLKHINEIIALK